MKAKYSRRVREEAALICAIAASGGVFAGRWTSAYNFISDENSCEIDSLHLAVHAWIEARGDGAGWSRETDAEAEALIRTGWSP